MVVFARRKVVPISARLYTKRLPTENMSTQLGTRQEANELYYHAGNVERLVFRLLNGELTFGRALEAARFMDSGKE